MTKGEVETRPALAQELSTNGLTDVNAWLVAKATEHNLKRLLAHADDGVIWGRMDGGQLVTSHDAAQHYTHAKNVCPPLRAETLQQARLFSQEAELLLWRNGDNQWHARIIQDTNAGHHTDWDMAIDEEQMLWGTHGEHLVSNFTLLRDGQQGLRHAFPQKLPLDNEGRTDPPRLVVRHYLNKDGFTRIVASRLVKFEPEQEEIE